MRRLRPRVSRELPAPLLQPSRSVYETNGLLHQRCPSLWRGPGHSAHGGRLLVDEILDRPPPRRRRKPSHRTAPSPKIEECPTWRSATAEERTRLRTVGVCFGTCRRERSRGSPAQRGTWTRSGSAQVPTAAEGVCHLASSPAAVFRAVGPQARRHAGGWRVAYRGSGRLAPDTPRALHRVAAGAWIDVKD